MTPLARKLAFLPLASGGDAAGREYARGRQDAEIAAMERMEAALDNERQRLAEELARERQTWAAEEGERLSSSLAAAVAEVERRLHDCMARILQPFLEDEIREKALRSFTRTTRSLIEDGDAIRLTVAGPEDLLARAFGEGSPAACVVKIEPGRPDVSATFGETRIETEIGAWIARIRECAP